MGNVLPCLTMSYHVLHVLPCPTCLTMSYHVLPCLTMSHHVLHVLPCPTCPTMSYMSYHVLHVLPCPTCLTMSYHVLPCPTCGVDMWLDTCGVVDMRGGGHVVDKRGSGHAYSGLGLCSSGVQVSVSGSPQRGKPACVSTCPNFTRIFTPPAAKFRSARVLISPAFFF